VTSSRRKAFDIAGVIAVVGAIAAFGLYSALAGSTQLLPAQTIPGQSVQVTAANSSGAVARESHDLAFTILIPAFLPWNGLTLVSVGGDAHAMQQVIAMRGSNPPTPVFAYMPGATLNYRGADGAALTIIEISGEQSGLPPAEGSLVLPDPAANTELFDANVRLPSGQGAQQYTFNAIEAGMRVVVIGSGPDKLSRDDAIHMFTSLKGVQA